MNFDFTDYHTFHIVAAYAVTGLLIGGLGLLSLRGYLRAKSGKE